MIPATILGITLGAILGTIDLAPVLAQPLPPSGETPGSINAASSPAERFLSQGLLAIQQGQLPRAIESFRAAINANPSLAPAHYNLGLALRQTGDLSGAIGAFSRAIQADPNFALAYSNLGAALLEQNQLDQAALYLNQSIQLDPTLSIAHYNLGLVYQQQGNGAAAQRSLETALKLNSNSPQVFYRLGMVYQQQGEQNPESSPAAQQWRGRALSAFQQAIILEPSYTEAHYRLGSLHYAQGNYAAAIRAFRQTAELNPANGDAYYAAALSFVKLNQPQDALMLFEYALKLYQSQNLPDWIDRTTEQIDRLRGN